MPFGLNRAKIVLLLGSSLFLHGVVLWTQRWAIPIGFPDFSIFYTAGTILREGKGAELYDQKLQEAVQKSFAAGGVANRGSILPFFHPPFEAVFFLPFTRFSYLTAYLLWMAINLAMVVTLSLWLRRELPALDFPVWFWALSGLAFTPIFIALVQGQDSILLLFCYTAAFLALRRNADFAAGSWLALGLVKYHLLLPFLLAFLWQRRNKVIAGFLVGAALLGVIAYLGVGWQGLRSYPQYVWQSEHSSMYRWNNFHGNTTNLRGLLLTEWPGGELPQRAGWMRGLVIGVSLVFLGVTGRCWLGFKSFKSPEGELAFALNLAATLLVSYHAFVQDMSLLFLALPLTLNLLLSHAEVRGWQRSTILICAALLLCAPVYLVLILKFSQLSAITWIVLAFFAALVGAFYQLGKGARTASG